MDADLDSFATVKPQPVLAPDIQPRAYPPQEEFRAVAHFLPFPDPSDPTKIVDNHTHAALPVRTRELAERDAVGFRAMAESGRIQRLSHVVIERRVRAPWEMVARVDYWTNGRPAAMPVERVRPTHGGYPGEVEKKQLRPPALREPADMTRRGW